jgi:hypothetical protein
MEKKIVQLEIGKVLAVIIAVVVIAILAAMVFQGSYFKGDAGGVKPVKIDKKEFIETVKTDEDAITLNQDALLKEAARTEDVYFIESPLEDALRIEDAALTEYAISDDAAIILNDAEYAITDDAEYAITDDAKLRVQ